eukprot:403342549
MIPSNQSGFSHKTQHPQKSATSPQFHQKRKPSIYDQEETKREDEMNFNGMFGNTSQDDNTLDSQMLYSSSQLHQQELNAGLGMNFNKGFQDQNEFMKAQQLDCQKCLSDFDENNGQQHSHLGTSYLTGQNQNSIHRDLQNISRKNKEQHQNMLFKAQTHKEFDLNNELYREVDIQKFDRIYENQFDIKSGTSQIQKSNLKIFNHQSQTQKLRNSNSTSSLNKAQSNQYTKNFISGINPMKDILKLQESVNSLPKKKRLNSQKQQSFKDSEYRRSVDLLGTIVEEDQRQSKDLEASDSNFFYNNKSPIKQSSEYIVKQESSNSSTEQEKYLKNIYQNMIPQDNIEDAQTFHKNALAAQTQKQPNFFIDNLRPSSGLGDQQKTHQDYKTSRNSTNKFKKIEFLQSPKKSRGDRLYSHEDPFFGKALITDEEVDHHRSKRQIDHKRLTNDQDYCYEKNNQTDRESSRPARSSSFKIDTDILPNHFNLKKKDSKNTPNSNRGGLIIAETDSRIINQPTINDIINHYGNTQANSSRNYNIQTKRSNVDQIQEVLSNEESKVPSPQNELRNSYGPTDQDGVNLNRENMGNIKFKKSVESQLQSSEHVKQQAQLHLEQKIKDGYDEDSENSSEDQDDFQEESKSSKSLINGQQNLLSSTYDISSNLRHKHSKLNVMVCGPAGIGKTSFLKVFLKKFDKNQFKSVSKDRSKQQTSKLNTEQQTPIIDHSRDPNHKQTIKNKITRDVIEYDVPKTISNKKISLKFIDSVGYGDCMDLQSWRKYIQKYIKSMQIEYMKEHERIMTTSRDRYQQQNEINKIPDNRVHLLLYFFNGHHTNECDFDMIKKLQRFVNILPMIAKGDSFKPDELLIMKNDIAITARNRDIHFFDCIHAIKEKVNTDEECRLISQELLNTGLNEESKSSTHYCPPFSIVNPVDKKVIMKDGKRHVTYGRNYSYGFCDAFSDDHSDFGRLYKLITNIIWDQLIEITDKSITNEYIMRRREKELLKKTLKTKDCRVQQTLIGLGLAAIGGVSFIAMKFRNNQ